jgi:hypothetical protein
MSDGFFFWYRTAWTAAEAAAVLRALDRAGLPARNPLTGVATVLSAEPQTWGERLAVPESELARALLLEEAEEVSLQLWADPSADVYTRVRRTAAGIAVEFGLDGLGERRNAVVGALVEILTRFRGGCLGFVLDAAGATAGTPWEAVVEGTERWLTAWPDLLGLDGGFADRLQGPTPPPRFADGGLAVFSRFGGPG